MAGAGFGTSGELIEFGKRKQLFRKGLAVETNLSSNDKVTGLFNVKTQILTILINL